MENNRLASVVEQGREMSAYIKNSDLTRPVTVAVHGFQSFTKEKFFNLLDICGYNYEVLGEKTGSYIDAHIKTPNHIMYGAETYPMDAVLSWENTIKYSWVIGDFVWTAIDYKGEASIGWNGYPQKKEFYLWN